LDETPKGGQAIEGNPPISPLDFRQALGRFASGVTVITTCHGEHTHGMTANAFLSVSLDPPLVLVSIANQTRMHRLLSASRRYGVSVLAQGQQALSSHFAGRVVAGLQVPLVTLHAMPVIEGAVAHVIAEVVQAVPAGDHTLYIGRVEHLDWRDDRPLLFYAGNYGRLALEQPRPATRPEDDFSLFSIGNFDVPIGTKEET
jgi:flavin reductase (DIM6/NTAB) family NADH-FMN oxidoreductase RutF